METVFLTGNLMFFTVFVFTQLPLALGFQFLCLGLQLGYRLALKEGGRNVG